MRDNPELNKYRVRDGRLASDDSYGNVGAFRIPYRHAVLQVIAADGLDWDHVSVVPIDRHNLRPVYRTPSWEEMSFIKGVFFGPDECVVQYHPPRASYVNAHDYCLHLWRPQKLELPMPDPIMVGPK